MALPGFLLAAVALVATAVAASSALRLRSLPSFLLAVYLLASAELVVLGEALSLLGRAGAVGYAACEALLLAAAIATWEVRGRPPPPLPALDLRAAMRRHPILTALGIVVGGALGYQLFIAVGTPPNNWDSMSYHLPRAVEWLQRGGVTYVPGAATERMNALQPVGELEILWTLAFLGTDAAAALPQLLAELASLLATYAIARRIGFGRPDAAFASLLAATLTQVALQSVTSQNDLVAASFVVAAAALILGRSGSDVALAGLALALALGTKLTSAYALPVLVALALVTLSRRRLAECAAAAATAFLLVGSYGYVLNRVETGRLLGDRSVTDPYRPAQVTLEGTASTVARIGFRFFDLSALHPKSEVPEAISAAGRHIFDTLGIPANPAETSVEPRFDFAVGQAASEDISYFGPLGVLLVLPLSIGFAVVSITRREQWQRLALALALPVTVLEIALTYRYNIWLGRFLIMPVLLTMPLAAVLYRRLARGRSCRRGRGRDPRGGACLQRGETDRPRRNATGVVVAAAGGAGPHASRNRGRAGRSRPPRPRERAGRDRRARGVVVPGVRPEARPAPRSAAARTPPRSRRAPRPPLGGRRNGRGRPRLQSGLAHGSLRQLGLDALQAALSCRGHELFRYGGPSGTAMVWA
jgi:hypothetical protein